MFIGEKESTEFQTALRNFLKHHRSTIAEVEAIAQQRPLTDGEQQRLSEARAFVTQHERLRTTTQPRSGADRPVARVIHFLRTLATHRHTTPVEGLTETSIKAVV